MNGLIFFLRQVRWSNFKQILFLYQIDDNVRKRSLKIVYLGCIIIFFLILLDYDKTEN